MPVMGRVIARVGDLIEYGVARVPCETPHGVVERSVHTVTLRGRLYHLGSPVEPHGNGYLAWDVAEGEYVVLVGV